MDSHMFYYSHGTITSVSGIQNFDPFRLNSYGCIFFFFFEILSVSGEDWR